MATRVFELARELGVKSKDILVKCRAEEIEVKNHMASLSAGLEETIREWFSEESGKPHTAVEETAHVDLDKARKRAQKTRRRKTIMGKADEANQPDAVGIAEPVGDQVVSAVAEAPSAVETPPAETVETPTEAPVPEPPEKSQPEEIIPAGPQVVPKPAQLKGPRVIRVEQPDYTTRPRQRQRGDYVGPPGA